MTGLFMSFEGGEGSGKSTQARYLADALRGRGGAVVMTREPGGTPAGEVIRGLLQHDASGEALTPEAELLLFAAGRAQLVRRVIRPALARGATVICDRFCDSTTAYQGYARGLDLERVRDLQAWAVDGTLPDITILLDVPARVGLARKGVGPGAGRGDRFEREAVTFHERVREGYLDLARREPERIRVIRGDEPPETVRERVWAEVVRRLPDEGHTA